MVTDRSNLVEKSGILHIYYANKTFKHWKKRWLHLQDQQLSIYQDSNYKRHERTINVRNYRVSVTNSDDSISYKGYTFKMYNPNNSSEKPVYFSAESKQSMTQWINALRLSASIANDFLVEPDFATDLHPIDTDSESDYNGWMDDNSSRLRYKSYRPTMPVATTTTINDQSRFLGSYDEEETMDDQRWYRPRSTSPSYSRANVNGVIHQSSSATMGSWGFDVNRSANEQTTPSTLTSNTHHHHHNSNNNNSDHRTITRTPRRYDESIGDYDERLVDRSASPPPPQRFKLRTPTLTKHRDANDFAVVDRLVLGPSRVVQSDYYPSDDSPRQQQNMPSSSRSRQSSTRSILRRRSKSIGDFTAPTTSTSPPPHHHHQPTQSYQQYQYHERQRTSPTNHQPRSRAEQELMAWQNRMLERDHRTGNNLINRPPSTNNAWTQSPRMSSKRGGFNPSQSTTRPMPGATRPISAMSNTSNTQRFDSDQSSDPNLNASKLIKRYMELVYYIQTYYERISEQLYGGNAFLRTADQSVFLQHCRRIAEQLQRSKPVWDQKIIELQHALRDLSSYESSLLKNETTFLQRRSTLTNVLQTLNSRKDLDSTSLTILNDIERVLQYDKLAAQLQDELSTLLHHHSLLNDFTSLLQWNRQIYSHNEQNRVENVLPSLREQISTVDRYVSNVSQNLTRCVTKLRSLEKYILSHLNTIPLLDDGPISTNRSSWRAYNETDIDTLRTRNQPERYQDDYLRPTRQQSRPLSMHTSVNQAYHRNASPNTRNENSDWHRRSPSPPKTRSASMTRYIDSSEPTRGPSTDNFVLPSFPPQDFDEFRPTSSKRSPRRANPVHLNTNNSNNNPTPSARIATVKSARRDHGMQLNSILKPYPHTKANTETKKDFDIDTIDKEIYKPDKVDIPDRLIDFGNEEQMLTPNERLAKMKKKEEVRKMLSKQSMQEMNEHDLYDSDPYNQRRIDKALNLQSAIAEEAKEKSRQVAAKHYLNKSYHQQATRLNS